MRSSHAAMIGLFLVATSSQALAQAPPSGKTLAATMNVYVFPSNGQDAAQQSKDEAECYNWAVTNTGTDPFVTSPAELGKFQLAESEKWKNIIKKAGIEAE